MRLGLRGRARELRHGAGAVWRHICDKRSEYLDVLLLCHALEKGMGMPVVRRGFGRQKCERLIDSMRSLCERGRNLSWEYGEALAVLRAYLEYQEADGVDVSDLRAAADPLLQSEHVTCEGGWRMVGHDEMMRGTQIDVPALFESKHSMRAYSQEPVTEEEFSQAVSLARRSPSACNRQPWRVYYTLDRQKAQKIAGALPRQAFLDDVPYFCVVTCDRTLFNRSEFAQWFVNGGIFVSYLTLALHYGGIGSVALEYNVGSKSEPALRKEMGIRNQDEVIAIVGFGRYPDEGKWIRADRRDVNDIAIRN